jgi:hypothetical protein
MRTHPNVGAALAVALLAFAYASSAFATGWYLMAPEQGTMSNPMASSRLNHGSVVGPLHATSQGAYDSREQCEAARGDLVGKWRKLGTIKRGGWDRFGLRSPDEFIRCVASNDQQLKQTASAAGTPAPSMDLFINVKSLH